jgi:hypothetical protein
VSYQDPEEIAQLRTDPWKSCTRSRARNEKVNKAVLPLGRVRADQMHLIHAPLLWYNDIAEILAQVFKIHRSFAPSQMQDGADLENAGDNDADPG